MQSWPGGGAPQQQAHSLRRSRACRIRRTIAARSCTFCSCKGRVSNNSSQKGGQQPSRASVRRTPNTIEERKPFPVADRGKRTSPLPSRSVCCPAVSWAWLESTAAVRDGARRTTQGVRQPPTVGSGRNIDGRPREVRQRTGWRGRREERRGSWAKAKDYGSGGCGYAGCVWACCLRRGVGVEGGVIQRRVAENNSSEEVEPGSGESRGRFHGGAACRSLALQGMRSNQSYSHRICAHARQPDASTIQKRQPDAYSMRTNKKTSINIVAAALTLQEHRTTTPS